MIRVTHDDLDSLRKGTIREAVVPNRPKLNGAYTVYAPRVLDDTGDVAQKRRTMRVVVVAAQKEPAGWHIAFRAGDAEQPRFLKARPGGSEGDYTTIPGRGASHEPEAVSRLELKRQADDARSSERRRQDYERRRAITLLESELMGLHGDSGMSITAARYVRRMRADLDRLRRELRAA